MSKTKSIYVQSVDAIQSSVHQFLKHQGFRKNGRSHSRLVGDGIVQVVQFFMGQYPLGDNYVVPGLREDLYGTVRIDLGVFLPAVWDAEHDERPNFIRGYHCSIRDILPLDQYTPDSQDDWLYLTRSSDELSTTVVTALDEHGLPFLECFGSYADVFSYYEQHGALPFQNPHRASLEIALIAHHMSKRELVALALRRAHDTTHAHFRQYVEATAKRLGYSLGEQAA